jgi:hypothetical protein
MLERASSKVPVTLLFLLTLLSLLFTATGLALSALWSYIGFFMGNGSTWICSNYLTYKLVYNQAMVFDAALVGAATAAFVQILLVIQLIYLVVKYCKETGDLFAEFSEMAIVRLYVGYSIGLLGITVAVGYYASYIIEEGIICLGAINLNLIIIGSAFFGGMIMMLVAWIYLLVFWIKNRQVFDE